MSVTGLQIKTKASHDTAVKRICRYLQVTKANGLVLNPSKKLVANCYAGEDFAGLWRNENYQDPNCTRSRTGFVVTFANCLLLWVSKIHIDIALSDLHSGYVSLSHSIRPLLPLKILIKEVTENFRIDSEKLKFESSSTVHKDNNGSIVVANIPSTTPTSKHIAVKYHWFRKHIGK